MKTSLLVRANHSASGQEPMVEVTPEAASWRYVGFQVYRAAAGTTVDLSRLDHAGKETCVIVLEGTCDIYVGNQKFAAVGSRDSVFSDASPEAVYSPPGEPIRVVAQTKSEFAVALAASESGISQARYISAQNIPYEVRGEGQTRRYIRHILDEHHEAVKLLLVEVVTPGGNWSSYPPHKHDEEIPDKEAYLEETYYYRISPAHGHAYQHVYDKHGLDEVLTPGDGDVVLVPRGYHPVAAMPGFDAYYLNVMAGHHRVWKYTLDSDFAHIAPKDGNIMGEVKQN